MVGERSVGDRSIGSAIISDPLATVSDRSAVICERVVHDRSAIGK